jgi:hypothetical protein
VIQWPDLCVRTNEMAVLARVSHKCSFAWPGAIFEGQGALTKANWEAVYHIFCGFGVY